MPTYSPARTSGKTPAGRAISARNATTHGLFCRQTVLPHLGEDPAAYQRVLDTLQEQLRPRNLMEHQYLELFADASWKLRRLSRLEAQVWEDDRLDEDARLTKLERLARLQGGLRRQLDKSVRMLSQDVPSLFAHRTREDVVEHLHLTESLCAQSEYRERTVEEAVQANRHWPAPGEGFTDGLDNVPTPPTDAVSPPADAPAPPLPATSSDSPRIEDGEAAPPAACEDKNCQNELPSSPLRFGEGGAGRGTSAVTGGVLTPEEDAPPSRRPQRQQELQELEDLLNSGTLTSEERHQLLMRQDIPGWTMMERGRYKIHHR